MAIFWGGIYIEFQGGKKIAASNQLPERLEIHSCNLTLSPCFPWNEIQSLEGTYLILWYFAPFYCFKCTRHLPKIEVCMLGCLWVSPKIPVASGAFLGISQGVWSLFEGGNTLPGNIPPNAKRKIIDSKVPTGRGNNVGRNTAITSWYGQFPIICRVSYLSGG